MEGPLRAPASRGVTPRLRETAEPEVLVVNQIESVRRLVRAVNDGLVTVVPEPAGKSVAPPAEIVVPPLVVDALPVLPVDPDGLSPSPGTGRS
jgi:hypothetical protein